mgnify:CR=1 FL=1
MATLVFVESAEGKIKNTSLEAVVYAARVGGDITAITLGTEVEDTELESLGKYGASKVLKVSDDRLNQGVIQAYANVLSQAMDNTGADLLVLANSSLGAPVSARVAIKQDASLVSNVTELPDTSNGFKLKRSIYTGKAFANVELTKAKKVIAIKKNAAEISESEGSATVETFSPELSDENFGVSITGVNKATGDVLLPEAEIVVSGGRGLKGPENWGMIEGLAEELGAATGCSKPVSDIGWRPHHEHVGQTGVKVSPTLYIAVGISGAIQHLAGVNSSKYIVVVNKDEDAPIFKAADYGIAGDAFEIIPKLTEALKAAR